MNIFVNSELWEELKQLPLGQTTLSGFGIPIIHDKTLVKGIKAIMIPDRKPGQSDAEWQESWEMITE